MELWTFPSTSLTYQKPPKMSKYVVLGTTDAVDTCERCGRQDLKKAVMLGEVDADGTVMDINYFGSTCAAKMARRSQQSMDKSIREVEDEIITGGFGSWIWRAKNGEVFYLKNVHTQEHKDPSDLRPKFAENLQKSVVEKILEKKEKKERARKSRQRTRYGY